jgi:predicted TIM-barrel fold metal-dependent hydrolase
MVAANGPIVRDTIAIFGIDRCMFASNFPVDRLCADFHTIFTGFEAIVGDLTQDEQRKLFYTNVLRIHRLDP